MRCDVHYSPEFLNDLDEIWDYISFELLAPDAAERTIDRLLDVIRTLKDFPERGSRFFLPWGADSGYRYVISGNFIAFYRFLNGEVHVARAMYQGRDYVGILFPEL